MTSLGASGTNITNEASSWADLVRKVDYERKNLPWDPKQTEPVQRGSLYHRKRAEREYDPVATQYRDPEREAAAQAEKKQQLQTKKQTVEEYRRNTFNIVSHEGPPRKFDHILKIRNEQYEKNKNQSRPYHLVTNLPPSSHAKTSIYYDEEKQLQEYAESFKNSRLAKHGEMMKSKGKDREFNIISNDFYEHPEEKKNQEYLKLKKHVLEKFWNTHDYDPIKGAYYSPEKEEVYQQQKQILNEVYGKSKELTIPPSIQYAESTSYNIINHDIKDDFKLSISMTSNQRSINRMNKLSKELRMIEKAEEKKASEEQRHFNRVSFKRWETEIDRKYNPIKNEVVPNPYQPLPSRPATMWERLSTSSNPQQNRELTTVSADEGFVNQFPSRGVTAGLLDSNNSGRIRNLANSAPAIAPSPIVRDATARAQTSAPSYGNEAKITGRSNQYSETAKPKSAIPKLDLTKAETGEPVSYQEPYKGPPGLSVPIVRTGGLSQY